MSLIRETSVYCTKRFVQRGMGEKRAYILGNLECDAAQGWTKRSDLERAWAFACYTQGCTLFGYRNAYRNHINYVILDRVP